MSLADVLGDDAGEDPYGAGGQQEHAAHVRTVLVDVRRLAHTLPANFNGRNGSKPHPKRSSKRIPILQALYFNFSQNDTESTVPSTPSTT